MTAETTISLTDSAGRPLEVLAELIAKRQRLLRETTDQSVTACAITALKSIRAATSKHKGGATVTTGDGDVLSVAVSEMPGFRIGLTGGAARSVCVRDAAGDRRPEIRPWFQVAPADLRRARLFKIVLSGDRLKAWPHQRHESFMVALSLDSALAICKRRFSKIANSSSSLARDALSRAMMLSSGRLTNYENQAAAERVLGRNGMVKVSREKSGVASGEFSLTIEDNLRYAADATKISISAAVQKAANSIAGYLNRVCGAALDEKIETPFPKETLTP